MGSGEWAIRGCVPGERGMCLQPGGCTREGWPCVWGDARLGKGGLSRLPACLPAKASLSAKATFSTHQLIPLFLPPKPNLPTPSYPPSPYPTPSPPPSRPHCPTLASSGCTPDGTGNTPYSTHPTSPVALAMPAPDGSPGAGLGLVNLNPIGAGP